MDDGIISLGKAKATGFAAPGLRGGSYTGTVVRAVERLSVGSTMVVGAVERLSVGSTMVVGAVEKLSVGSTMVAGVVDRLSVGSTTVVGAVGRLSVGSTMDTRGIANLGFFYYANQKPLTSCAQYPGMMERFSMTPMSIGEILPFGWNRAIPDMWMIQISPLQHKANKQNENTK